MKKRAFITAILLIFSLLLCLSSCEPIDKSYASTQSETASEPKKAKKAPENVKRPKIMSDDTIMPQYVDISVFDEENYSAVYLGKKFKISAEFAGEEFTVPATVGNMESHGWTLAENSAYDKESLVYAGESVDTVFVNEDGVQVNAKFYNSSQSSVKLSKCNIVKFKIINDFYSSPDNFHEFNINGVNNKMAITDIIDTLGTPSHFYGIDESNYYLDYFISQRDRRNGITVYINPSDDAITAIEFSYYK